MQHTYKILSRITTLKAENLTLYQPELSSELESVLQKIMLSIALKHNLSEQGDLINKFIAYMNEYRGIKIHPDYLKNSQQIKIIACNQSKVYTFDPNFKAFCLFGKAVSILKRKNKEIENQRNNLCAQTQSAIFQLYSQGLLPLSKSQSHQIDDILLNFNLPQQLCDPLLLSNQVYSPFVSQPYALVMIMPNEHPKSEYLLNFLKGSLLHIYADNVNALNKVVSRELFYKNSVVRGIYFIEEGQVQSTGGRVVARGWVSNGKCKCTGYGWKFKPIPFLKAIAKNQHIWKQFLNDIVLNHEYPFKVSFLLGLEEEVAFEKYQKRGAKRSFLPRIGHGSFDYGKLTQIQKVKHYDDRINDICDFKQRLFLKKSGGSLQRPLANIVTGMEGDKNHRRMMLKHQSKSKLSTSLSSSTENILIMSVLKKLQGLTQQSARLSDDNRQKRDKIKISPALLYQKSRVMKKKRYVQ